MLKETQFPSQDSSQLQYFPNDLGNLSFALLFGMHSVWCRNVSCSGCDLTLLWELIFAGSFLMTLGCDFDV